MAGALLLSVMRIIVIMLGICMACFAEPMSGKEGFKPPFPSGGAYKPPPKRIPPPVHKELSNPMPKPPLHKPPPHPQLHDSHSSLHPKPRPDDHPSPQEPQFPPKSPSLPTKHQPPHIPKSPHHPDPIPVMHFENEKKKPSHDMMPPSHPHQKPSKPENGHAQPHPITDKSPPKPIHKPSPPHIPFPPPRAIH